MTARFFGESFAKCVVFACLLFKAGGAFANENSSPMKQPYAAKENCNSVLSDLEKDQFASRQLKETALQICETSRLADDIGLVHADVVYRNYRRSVRSVGVAGELEQSSLPKSVVDKLEREQRETDKMINLLARTDAKQANDLLKRLLGRDEKNN